MEFAIATMVSLPVISMIFLSAGVSLSPVEGPAELLDLGEVVSEGVSVKLSGRGTM